MDRRKFFKSGFRKAANKVVEYAEKKAEQQAQHWIRPPYAINELDFLVSCTRCVDCIEACPHEVVFPLSARVGLKAANTPALDLLNKACHLCEDWPCVAACKVDALKLPELETGNDIIDRDSSEIESIHNAIPLPILGKASINTQTCLPYSGPDCGACNICTVPGALLWDQQRPYIDPEKCTGCCLCRESCIVDPSAIDIAPLGAD